MKHIFWILSLFVLPVVAQAQACDGRAVAVYRMEGEYWTMTGRRSVYDMLANKQIGYTFQPIFNGITLNQAYFLRDLNDKEIAKSYRLARSTFSAVSDYLVIEEGSDSPTHRELAFLEKRVFDGRNINGKLMKNLNVIAGSTVYQMRDFNSNDSKRNIIGYSFKDRGFVGSRSQLVGADGKVRASITEDAYYGLGAFDICIYDETLDYRVPVMIASRFKFLHQKVNEINNKNNNRRR